MHDREESSSAAVTDAFASIKLDAGLASPSFVSDSTQGIGIDTQMLKNLTEDVGTEDSEMLGIFNQPGLLPYTNDLFFSLFS
jgi:hypothetical protein